MIVVADAGSTDGTPEVALSVAEKLDLRLQVVKGGLPSAGRNAGSYVACTCVQYILFLDADVFLGDPRLIERAVTAAKTRNLSLVTTDIFTNDGPFKWRAAYWFSNLCQRASRYVVLPFATGMFMLWDKYTFRALKGFDERIHFAEDFALSRQVPRRRFAVVPGGVVTQPRRFEKMGLWRMVQLFWACIFNAKSEKFFLKDHKYWA